MARRIEELEQALADATQGGNKQTAHNDTPPSLGAATPATCSNPTATFAAHVQTATQSPIFESTSAIQEPMATSPATLLGSSPLPMFESMTQASLDAWESAALDSCATTLRLPRSKVAHLLQTYWTWVHPSFMFVREIKLLARRCHGRAFILSFTPLRALPPGHQIHRSRLKP